MPNTDRLIDILNRTHTDGMDFKEGLRRFSGNAGIYLKILRTFEQNIPAHLERLAAAREASLADYATVVHGIKGSCYGVGATRVGKLAEGLEIAAKAGDAAGVDDGHPAFVAEAMTLLSALSALAAEVEKTVSKPPAASAAAPDRAQLRNLLEACREYDTHAMKNAMDELEKYSYRTEGELVAWLRDRLIAFAYAEIEARLAALL